ncbi:MAG: hypothetical protein HWE27_12060 [Gammaproteobacteria bacterium]|nr:hypothetical protein [Gammaproteobacteria bacterium]
MMTELLGKIVGLILAHGVLIGNDLPEGELLVPVVIYYEGNSRKLEAFEADTQQEAVDLANQFLNDLPKSVDSWTFIREGAIALSNNEKQDVYYIKAWTQGMSEPMELYQMYNTKPFELVGNIKIINFSETGIKAESASVFTKALYEGVFSHPSDNKEILRKWFN